MPAVPQMSKKRKFVNDGVFQAELNEFLSHELAAEGYSGVEVRQTPLRTEIVIRATRTQSVLGEKGRRIRELTSAVQKRFNMAEGAVELYAERLQFRGLCAQAQAESLKYKLLGGLAVRRACYGVLRYIMENGAKGCEITISGKLRGARAKGMKFKDGYMIKSGYAVNYYVDEAIRHILLKQGVLGIKVKIMLAHDPSGKQGPAKNLSDVIIIRDLDKVEADNTATNTVPSKQGFAQQVNQDGGNTNQGQTNQGQGQGQQQQQQGGDVRQQDNRQQDVRGGNDGGNRGGDNRDNRGGDGGGRRHYDDNRGGNQGGNDGGNRGGNQRDF